VFTAGDSFRGKFNVFRNDVDDYIDLVGSAPIPPLLIPGFPGVFSQFFQYQNIAHARIEGVEWETLYDAGLWYVGVSGHLIRGKNVQTGVGLATIIPRKVTTTAGVRLPRPPPDPGGAVVVIWRQYRHPGRICARDQLRAGQSLPDVERDQRHCLYRVDRQSAESVLSALRHPRQQRRRHHAERRVVDEPGTGQGLQG
jgi:hypothetical protein